MTENGLLFNKHQRFVIKLQHSGLDSTVSLQVMSVLSDIAKTGRTIVAILHQPRYEIFEYCDNLILLAKGGRAVYSGSRKSVEQYFQGLGFQKLSPHTNVADFVMVCLNDHFLCTTVYTQSGL